MLSLAQESGEAHSLTKEEEEEDEGLLLCVAEQKCDDFHRKLNYLHKSCYSEESSLHRNI